jgi:hypothetical protein
MAYDYHVDAAGPIAPMAWVNDVVATAVAGVPASKVFLGVAAYGRSWVTGTTGTCPAGVDRTTKVVSPVEAAALATASKVRHTWDATTAERTFTYTRTYAGTTTGASPSATSCTVTRTVWYDDAAAIAARAKVAAAAHLGGIAVWSIDEVPAATWAALTSVSAAAHPAKVRASAAAPKAATSPRPSATGSPTATATPSGSGAAAPVPATSSEQPVAVAGATIAAELAPTQLAASTGPWRGPAAVGGLLALALLAGGFVLLRARRPVPVPVSAGRHARPPSHAAAAGTADAPEAPGRRGRHGGGGSHAAPAPDA